MILIICIPYLCSNLFLPLVNFSNKIISFSVSLIKPRLSAHAKMSLLLCSFAPYCDVIICSIYTLLHCISGSKSILLNIIFCTDGKISVRINLSGSNEKFALFALHILPCISSNMLKYTE